jgi:hypothetical protein
LSSFGKDKDKHHWALFVEYICTHYLTILTSHLAHIIYHVDLRPSSVPSPDDGPGHHGHHGHGHAHAVLQADPAEEVCVTETFGFDFLAAVTQTSVNAHLKHRHATLSVLRTSRTSDFECTFGPPRVQLQVPPSPSLGGRTVVLVLALTAGWLKVAGLGHG